MLVPQITPIPLDQNAEGIRLVCSHLPAEVRTDQVAMLLADIRAKQGPPRLLLGAYRGQQLTGAVLARVQPGRSAVVWTPRLLAGEPAATAKELLKMTVGWLAGESIRIAQIDLNCDPDTDATILHAGGFEPLADLLYLVSHQSYFPDSPPSPELEFEQYSEDNQGLLTRLVEATYVQSLDCPQLDGIRRIEDVLAGYRHTGVFDPARWLIVRYNGKEIGCLILAEHPEHDNWELVYMGIVASARGHGWGIGVTRHAQWLTGQAGRKRLVLAVDAANGPAIEMYAATGFQAWDRRSVYVKVFTPAE